MSISNNLIATAQVSEVEFLSPKVRRIRIFGSSLQSVSWVPGDKIKIRVGSHARSYTPARVNAQEGWMDLVFFLHGNGQASDWASSAQKGMEIGFLGPVKSMPYVEEDPDWAIFLGDETTIGLAISLMEGLPPSVQKYGAIELDQEDSDCLERIDLDLHPAIRHGEHGSALLKWLNTMKSLEGEGVVWLSGEVTSVRVLKQVLLDRGMERVQIKIKPYWSLRGHKHRKEIQRVL